MHLFRPVEPPLHPSPPVWRQWRGLLAVEGRRILLSLRRPFQSPAVWSCIRILLLLVGLVCQVVLLCLAAYLTDLAVSLMELWAELARKHLELTL